MAPPGRGNTLSNALAIELDPYYNSHFLQAVTWGRPADAPSETLPDG